MGGRRYITLRDTLCTFMEVHNAIALGSLMYLFMSYYLF